jgi:hypothetical protein
MSRLAEALKATRSERRVPGQCLMATFEATLPEDERKELRDYLITESLSSQNIYRALKEVHHEMNIGRTTFQMHRSGECSCRH